MNFNQRSYQSELLDNDHIPQADLYQNLRELEFINTYLSGHDVVLAGLQNFRKHSHQGLTICEIGSGGGDNLRAILKYKKKQQHEVNLIGIDLKQDCISFAQQADITKLGYSAIQYQCSDYRLASFNQKPDLIFNSLFCHHFTDEALIEMLCWMNDNANKGFYICDLHRHHLAYYSIKWLTRLFSASYLVKNDAALSVLRGFSRQEWVQLLAKAGIKNYTIQWKWAFRWLIVVHK